MPSGERQLKSSVTFTPSPDHLWYTWPPDRTLRTRFSSHCLVLHMPLQYLLIVFLAPVLYLVCRPHCVSFYSFQHLHIILGQLLLQVHLPSSYSMSREQLVWLMVYCTDSTQKKFHAMIQPHRVQNSRDSAFRPLFARGLHTHYHRICGVKSKWDWNSFLSHPMHSTWRASKLLQMISDRWIPGHSKSPGMH